MVSPVSVLRNILNLNERYAYTFIGRMRLIILPFFNRFLGIQKKIVRKKVSRKIQLLREAIERVLPEVTLEDLQNVLDLKSEQYLISEAERIIDKKIRVFSESVEFHEGIKWNQDYYSGYIWENGTIYSKYDQVNIKNNADVKFPRELSRFHHLLILGQAYIISEDDRYVEEYKNQILDWILKNPYKKSINWGCSMDVSIRASNWIYSLRMILRSSLIDDQFLIEFFTSLYLHGRFIFENPEKNRVYNHNHYISDLSGQILLGIVLNNLNEGEIDSWKEIGVHELFREIRIQILPSGFTYEKSTNYHRLVTELILYTTILMARNNISVPQDILFRIKQMVNAVVYYTKEDGVAPIIGDQDGGRFLPFYHYDINYHRYLINVASVLFEDDFLKNHSGSEQLDILFLMGRTGIENFTKMDKKKCTLESKSFPDAGFYIMRTSNVYAFINNSGQSHYEELTTSTHTHSDLLSFVYSYKNVKFLVDPGTYVYSSDPLERKKFRSTYMHNTLTVDSLSQNTLRQDDLWSMGRDSMPSENSWYLDKNKVVFEGSHTGYLKLVNPVMHVRRFQLCLKTDELIITDFLSSTGKHQITGHYHFDEGIRIQKNINSLECWSKGLGIEICFSLDEEINLDLKEDFISNNYHQKVLAPYATVGFELFGSKKFITRIRKME